MKVSLGKSFIILAIHLKPVSPSLYSTLYASAIAFTIGVETIVEATNSLPLKPFLLCCAKRKSVIITIVWLPLSSTILPWRSRTAIPIRSQSGSVPITISAPISSAFLSANVRASGSSGLGDFTVGKLPSGTACSSTMCTLVKPARLSTSGTIVIDVPCKEVNTIFSLSFSGALKSPCLIDASAKALSSSLSIYWIRLSSALNLISLKSRASIAFIISPSSGGTVCPPSCQYTL